MRLFAVAASGGEAADAADGVAESEAGGKGVAGAESGHVMLAHVPGCGHERGEQASGENSSRLQSVDAENVAEVVE